MHSKQLYKLRKNMKRNCYLYSLVTLTVFLQVCNCWLIHKIFEVQILITVIIGRDVGCFVFGVMMPAVASICPRWINCSFYLKLTPSCSFGALLCLKPSYCSLRQAVTEKCFQE